MQGGFFFLHNSEQGASLSGSAGCCCRDSSDKKKEGRHLCRATALLLAGRPVVLFRQIASEDKRVGDRVGRTLCCKRGVDLTLPQTAHTAAAYYNTRITVVSINCQVPSLTFPSSNSLDVLLTRRAQRTSTKQQEKLQKSACSLITVVISYCATAVPRKLTTSPWNLVTVATRYRHEQSFTRTALHTRQEYLLRVRGFPFSNNLRSCPSLDGIAYDHERPFTA